MRVSLTWLQELVGEHLQPDEVAALLTAGGLEVEAVTHVGAGCEAEVAEIVSVVPLASQDRALVAKSPCNVAAMGEGTAREGSRLSGGGVSAAQPSAPQVPGRVQVRTMPMCPDRGARVPNEGPHRGSNPVADAEKAQAFSVIARSINGLGVGDKVAFVRPGRQLKRGHRIEARTVRGELSEGMLCSAADLEIADNPHEVITLPDHAVGTLVADALRLEDYILELGVTPNRADALGHWGVARDLCALRGRRFEAPLGTTCASGTPAIALDIQAPSVCEGYAAVAWQSVCLRPSPWEVQALLNRLGQRPVSNIVDATNLTLLETGHPVHAFDRERLAGTLAVRMAVPNESITLLDGSRHVLEAGDVVIADAQGPQALAGIMGGATSEVNASTSALLIEAAHFAPESVRRTAKRLGLHTDASHRFERGLGSQGLAAILATCARWLQRLGAGGCCTGLTSYTSMMAPRTVQLRPARFAAFMGRAVAAERMAMHLRHLGCEVTLLADRAGQSAGEAPSALEVIPPDVRRDLTREVDLIEEVARLEGYETFQAALPALVGAGGIAPLLRREARAAAALRARGLGEAVTFAFISSAWLKIARAPASNWPLQNPLTDDRDVLRPLLYPSLLDVLLDAQRRQQSSAALFEIGTVFQGDGASPKPTERTHLAWVLSGTAPGWLDGSQEVDYYDAKAIVEMLAPAGALRFSDAELPAWLHPRQSATLWSTEGIVAAAEGAPIGWVGVLHPEVREALGLRGAIVVGEVELAALPGSVASALQDPPRFPAAERDLAFEVPHALRAETLVAALRAAGGETLVSVVPFDLYEDAALRAAGCRSLAFRCVFRDLGRTLTDEEVTSASQAMRVAGERLGARTRL